MEAQTNIDSGEGDQSDTWFSGYDDDTKGWITARGLDKLEPDKALPEVIKGYRGAESKLGVPSDQLLRLPGEKATPEEWKSIYQRLGAPENAEGYELPVPEGDDGVFAKEAAAWFSELGVPKNMATGIASKYNEFLAKAQEAQDAQWNQRFDTETGALKEEWKGDEYDKNVDLAKRVMRNSGWTPEQLTSIERALGPKALMQGFANYGKMLGEHRFVENGGSQSFSTSPEGAKVRIGELKKDPAWMASYIGGDAEKKAEFKRLHEIAFPEQSE